MTVPQRTIHEGFVPAAGEPGIRRSDHGRPPQSGRSSAPCFALSPMFCLALGCTPLADLDRHSAGSGIAPGAVPEPGADAGADAASPRAVPDGGIAPPLERPPVDLVDAGPPSAGRPPAATPDAGAADEVAPRVASALPADGATGVRRETSITLVFSEPMDKASVEAAFASESLPDGPHSFYWDEAGTLLEVVLAEPLSHAVGTDPSQVSALRYEYRLTSEARDLAGNALPETSVSFSTSREIHARASAQTDFALTGNWRSDGVYGTDSCGESGGSMCVGDSSFGPNASYRGFVSFAVGALAEPEIDVIEARLQIQVVSAIGSPFGSLGALALEHTSFASIGPDAFQTPALAPSGTASGATASGTLSFDVLSALRADLESSRGLSQYRFRFQTSSDGDGSTDLLFLQRSSAALDVSYLLP